MKDKGSMKKIRILFVCLICCAAIDAQNEQRRGDEMAAAGNYSGAEIMYRQCMERDVQCRLKLFKLIYDEKIEAQSSYELFQLIAPLAQTGNPEAQYYLGMLYRKGIGGVRQDNNEASRWLQRSANQGYADARNELDAMRQNQNPARIVARDNMDNDYLYERNPVHKGATNRSGTLFAVGSVCIIGGIAATALLPKTYTDYNNGTIVEGKEYNLGYAVVGLVAGGICIGSGISLKKQGKAGSLSYRDDQLILNLVATGNGAGLRLTF